MENLIFNSTTQSSVRLSPLAAEALFRGIVPLCSIISQTNWQKDIAIWFSEHNQKLLGIGAAGFDITRMGWSKEDFYDQKGFILKVLQLTIRYKSWNNYMISIDDAEATQKTRELITLFEALEIADIQPGPIPFIFRAPDTTVYKYCKLDDHRNTLLNDAPEEYNQNCIVCGTTEIDETIQFLIREIELEGTWNPRFCLDIIPEGELSSKLQIYKIADRICYKNGFALLGNRWCEIDEASALQGISDGLTYDLAYTDYKIDTDEINSANIEKITTLLQDQESFCCLSNSEENPWSMKNGGGALTNLSPTWDFTYAYVIGCRNKVIFAFFSGGS